ncbi:MAG: TrkH family potassium uptake protein [Bacteroidales bacterium]|jgi:trk system potassium uptake protein TrkH|nr:TrkH family potassium uptake protein [Bacteroidales bacterium]
MNVSVISRNIGLALVFNAAFMFLSVVISIIFGFDSAFAPLFMSAVITLTAGFFPLIFVKKRGAINLQEGLVIIVFSWILSCLFGMLPYVLWGGEFSVINAWFESVSGYTTTGASILTDIEILPKSLIFWRSSTNFLGGLGITIFMFFILPKQNSSFRMKLGNLEIADLSRQNYRFRFNQTVFVIGIVYMTIFLVGWISLMLAGMNWYDAINHSFTCVSTGGFSTKNDSVAAFHSFPVELILVVLMYFSSLHFGLLYTGLHKRSLKTIFNSPVVKFYTLSLIIAILITTVSVKLSGDAPTWALSFRQCLFQVVTLATATGYGTADTSVWPSFTILVLVYLSLQGGCSGSTSGGIKADRMLIFFKSLYSQFKMKLHPNGVFPVRVGNEIVEKGTVEAANIFIVFYVFIVFISAMLVSAMGMSLIDAFTGTVSCMGGVGPAFGSLGSASNYNAIPIAAKFVFSIDMLLGRLELFSIILVFSLFKMK